jgi:hypothetical protein
MAFDTHPISQYLAFYGNLIFLCINLLSLIRFFRKISRSSPDIRHKQINDCKILNKSEETWSESVGELVPENEVSLFELYEETQLRCLKTLAFYEAILGLTYLVIKFFEKFQNALSYFLLLELQVLLHQNKCRDDIKSLTSLTNTLRYSLHPIKFIAR